jgi:hypothetical protein
MQKFFGKPKKIFVVGKRIVFQATRREHSCVWHVRSGFRDDVEILPRCHSFCMLHFIPRQKQRQRFYTAATAATYM